MEVGKKKYRFGPIPLTFPLPSPVPNQLGYLIECCKLPSRVRAGCKRMCVIFCLKKTRLVATKLPLRHIGMAVVRKKWQYGFKLAKEVPMCLTGPYRPTSNTDFDVPILIHQS